MLGLIGQQLAQHYGVIGSIKEVLHTIKVTFSQKGPARGTVYDRNLKQLAVTLERVSVYARTREIDSIQETATQLSDVLALDRENLEDRLESGVLRLWVAKDISQEQEVAIRDLQLPGVYLQRDEKRYYPNDFQAAHFIGYVENGIGLSGVEFYYDRLLAGRKVKQQEEDQPLSIALDLVLTIDLKIQDILENLVKDIRYSEQAEKVSAYLLESGTGEIIGGAIQPGFNPNTFARYSHEQMENMFLVPYSLPEKFRLFLRDATMLHDHPINGVTPPTWSLIPDNNNLGSQLRLWEWLGLEESLEMDFHAPTQSGEADKIHQQPVIAPATYYGFVPENATPLNLLTTFSILLNKGKKIHPFAVKKILDRENNLEVLLSEKDGGDGQVDKLSDIDSDRIVSLFRSQAKQGTSGAYFFRDDILASVEYDGRRQLLVNDLVFVTVPAGSNDLSMLIVVQRVPRGVSRKESKTKNSIEQIVEEKIDRISVLQQIAESVADVVERESADQDNYQGKIGSTTGISGNGKTLEKEKPVPGIMPDLQGLSLRKSLRLLQGTNLEFTIQGTGRVVDQKPLPGTSLKGITECVLILEKQENIAPEKLSKKQPEKE